MSIDNLLSAEDCESLELQYSQMTSEAEASITSLEDVLAGLTEIEQQAMGEGAICRTQAASLESIAPGILPRYASVQSFTERPSVTNLKIAMEEIDKKKAGIIAAIVIAAGAFLYKLWKWITGKSSSASDTMGAAAVSSEKVEKAEAQYKDAVQELQHQQVQVAEIEKKVKAEDAVLDKLQMISETYTVPVHLMFTSNLSEPISRLVGVSKNSKMMLDQMQSALNELIAKGDELVIDNSQRDVGERGADTAEKVGQIDRDLKERYNSHVKGSVVAFGQTFVHTFRTLAEHLKALNQLPLTKPTVPEIHAVAEIVSENIDDIFLGHLETAKSIKDGYSDFYRRLKDVESVGHVPKGYSEIEKVISNASKFTGQCAALAHSMKGFDDLSSIADMYSESNVAARAHKSKLGAQPGHVKHAEMIMVTYAQIIAQIVQIVNVIAANCKSFSEHCHTYQKTRTKSFGEKAKEYALKILGDKYPDKVKATNAIIEKLADDIR